MMKPSEKHKLIIETMTTDYNNINQEIFLIENAIIRDYQIAIAFIAALIAISFRLDPQFIHMLIILFPYILFVFSLVLIIKLSHLTNLASYKRIIENRINDEFGSNILSWHSSINKKLYFQLYRLFILCSTAIGLFLLITYFILSYISYNIIIPEYFLSKYDDILVKLIKLGITKNIVIFFFKFSYRIFPIIIIIFLLLLYYETKTFPQTINNLLNIKSKSRAYRIISVLVLWLLIGLSIYLISYLWFPLIL